MPVETMVPALLLPSHPTLFADGALCGLPVELATVPEQCTPSAAVVVMVVVATVWVPAVVVVLPAGAPADLDRVRRGRQKRRGREDRDVAAEGRPLGGADVVGRQGRSAHGDGRRGRGRRAALVVHRDGGGVRSRRREDVIAQDLEA